MTEVPSFIFLGYRVKQPWDPGPDWAPIERIVCVGDNLCEPPKGWVDRWDFNRASCYSDPESAWDTVGEERTTFRLFAYFVLPLVLRSGNPPSVVPQDEIFTSALPELPPPPAGPLDMAFLGYDIGEHSIGILGYDMSPLVNSGFSRDFPTNRYGLLNDLDTAIQACATINAEMPEHGPHWVFQVFGLDVD